MSHKQSQGSGDGSTFSQEHRFGRGTAEPSDTEPCRFARTIRPATAIRRLAVVFALSIGVVLTLLPAAGQAADSEKGDATKRFYASTFVSGRSGYRVIHYWSDGATMRAETLIGGHPVTTIVKGDQYLVFDRLTKQGLAITRAQEAVSAEKKGARPFGKEWVEIQAAGGERVEETNLSGIEVEVWQLTNDGGSQKVWVSKDAPRIPLRVEVYDRRSSDTVKTDYSNWKLNLDIPGAFFDAEQGVKFERFTYEDFVNKARTERVGTVPVLYPDLLHGTPNR
ncbi:MAG: hypothetical protein AB8G23_04265 [Myxococcota bacterium]